MLATLSNDGKIITITFNDQMNIKTLTSKEIKITDNKGKAVKFKITKIDTVVKKTTVLKQLVAQNTSNSYKITMNNVKDYNGNILKEKIIKVQKKWDIGILKCTEAASEDLNKLLK